MILRISYRFALTTVQFHCLSLLYTQCAIPVFDGLLPEPHNQAVLELLFVMAHWHGLAKLRMHNDLTLEVMDAVTVSLGDKLRKFTRKTCPVFATKELRRECDARVRRETKRSTYSRRQTTNAQNTAQSGSISQAPNDLAVPTTGQQQTDMLNPVQPSNARRRPKTFNLSTYKLHSLGDYVDTIRKYGTTDSYSTEPVCDVSIFKPDFRPLTCSFQIG